MYIIDQNSPTTPGSLEAYYCLTAKFYSEACPRETLQNTYKIAHCTLYPGFKLQYHMKTTLVVMINL